jgi:uncharacterized protein
VITLDTSGLFAAINVSDVDHDRARRVLATERAPWIIPALTFAELAYLIENRLGGSHLDTLLLDIQRRMFVVDFDERDFSRIRELAARYSNLPLGFADAAAIACAERNYGRIMTFDRRHFDIIAREGTIDVLPAFE